MLGGRAGRSEGERERERVVCGLVVHGGPLHCAAPLCIYTGGVCGREQCAGGDGKLDQSGQKADCTSQEGSEPPQVDTTEWTS